MLSSNVMANMFSS